MIDNYINLFKNFYEEEKYIKDHHNEEDLLVWLIKNYSNLLYMIKTGEEHTDTFEKLALETTEMYVNLLKMEDIEIEYPFETEYFEIEDTYGAVLSNLTTVSLLLNISEKRSIHEFLQYHHKNELTNLLYILL